MKDDAGNTLVQLQIIHRHGARSPTHGILFPSICGSAAFRNFFNFTPRLPPVSLHPSKPRKFTPSDAASCYKGQLTPVGAAQMFVLGARLRTRYAGFIPERFDKDLVKVRSTAVRRTVESAMATLSGMFTGDGGEVEVEVRERWRENLVGFRRGCNRLYELQMQAHGGFIMPGGVGEVVSGVLKEVLKRGEWGTESRKVIMLRDFAVASRENGCEPKGWEGVIGNVGERMVLRVYGRESWGLALGKFVEELLDNAEKHREQSWLVKLYSAHDTTLLPMMGCFEDVAKRGVPAFAADVVLETWESNKKYTEPMVKLRYEGEEVVIKGCEAFGALCPVSVVKRAVRERIPADWDKACGGQFNGGKEEVEEKNGAADGTTF